MARSPSRRARTARGLGALPHPLTFFLTVAERRAVLARLARTHPDRARALLMRLRIARTRTGGAR